MPLTNSQYNALMRVYEEKRAKSRDLANLHYERACQKVPELASIDASISSASLDQAKKLLAGDDTALASLKEEIRSLSDRRRRLLSDADSRKTIWNSILNVRTVRIPAMSHEKVPLLFKSDH